MENVDEIKGMRALDFARELSKLPDGCFTIAFFPYSRSQRIASAKLKVLEGCKARKALPDDRFSVHADNFFLFSDKEGNPKMCYRILIRFMGFPVDGFKLHKINWL